MSSLLTSIYSFPLPDTLAVNTSLYCLDKYANLFEAVSLNLEKAKPVSVVLKLDKAAKSL